MSLNLDADAALSLVTPGTVHIDSFPLSQSFLKYISDLPFYEFPCTLLFSRVLKHPLFVRLFVLEWNADALLSYQVIKCQ